MLELRHRPPECGAGAGTEATARVEPLPPPGLVSLRGDLAEARFRRAVEAASGLPLPEPGRESLDADGFGWYWMAPDELLLRLPLDAAGSALVALEAATGSFHRLLAEVSDTRAFFRISGAGAREVLAKGAPVDLHPEVFRPGMFRRTHLAGVAAAFSLRAVEPDRFELFCARSPSRYLGDWLVHAARGAALCGVYEPGRRPDPGNGTPNS